MNIQSGKVVMVPEKSLTLGYCTREGDTVAACSSALQWGELVCDCEDG